MEDKQKRSWPKIVFYSLLLFLILLISGFFLATFIRYKNNPDPNKTFLIPRLELFSTEVISLNADNIKTSVRMLIHNPLPFTIHADSLQYSIFINSAEVIENSYPKPLNIIKWDSTWVNLPVSIKMEKLLEILEKTEKEGKDSAIYKLTTKFYSKIPFRKHFNLEIEKRLPLIKIPEFKINKIEFDSLNFEGVTLYFHATINNRNLFALKFKELEFKVALAENPWIKGKKKGRVVFPKKGVTDLTLPVRVSFEEIGESIGPLLTKGGKIDYKFRMNLKVISDFNAVNNTPVFLKYDGSVSQVVQASKELGD